MVGTVLLGQVEGEIVQEQLVHDHPCAPHVTLQPVLAPLQHLWSHVKWAASDGQGLLTIDILLLQYLRQPEVRHLELPITEQYILRLDVSVDNPFRIEEVPAPQQLHRERECLSQRNNLVGFEILLEVSD